MILRFANHSVPCVDISYIESTVKKNTGNKWQVFDKLINCMVIGPKSFLF